jgi:hypothetical protein
MATNPVQPESDELTSFTAPSSSEPWALTPADAQAVIDSWDTHREPSEELKAAYRQLLDSTRKA